MKIRNLVAGGAVGVLTVTGLTFAPASAAQVCGGFDYNGTGNYGVFEVTASRVNCTVGEAVARASAETGPTYTYRSNGFRCHGLTDAEGGSVDKRDFVCNKKVGRKRPGRPRKVATITFWSVGN